MLPDSPKERLHRPDLLDLLRRHQLLLLNMKDRELRYYLVSSSLLRSVVSHLNPSWRI
jgi:hypothetical protein